LAEDIKRHGLLNPCVLDTDGSLVDGRLRIAACKRAGAEPRFIVLESGKDPIAYWKGEHYHRASYTPKRQAMVLVQAEKLGLPITTVSKPLLALIEKARLILEHVPYAVPLIRDGLHEYFDKAYNEALARIEGKKIAQQKADILQAEARAHAQTLQANAQTLQSDAPDFWAMAKEKGVDEAFAAYEKSRSIAASTVAEINRLHAEILEAARMTLDKALQVGALLASEKLKLRHGEWLPWLEANICFNERTARNYMRLHEHQLLIKTENVSDLSSAYALLRTPRKRLEDKNSALNEAWENASEEERQAFLRAVSFTH
jgi:Protein of unknown function (DUF3102)